MKTLICLTLTCTAILQAEPYTSDWAAFDAGQSQSQNGVISHVGMFGGWSGEPLHSADYALQAGPPSMPLLVPTTLAPLLSITHLGQEILLSWPVAAGTFVLEHSPAVEDSSWTPVPGPYQNDGTMQFILIAADQVSSFYRLNSAE
jgi:hypothetical protein